MCQTRMVDRAARYVFATTRTEPISCAMGLLVDSPVSRIIANFFLGLDKLPFVTRLFTSETEAVGWLRQFREC